MGPHGRYRPSRAYRDARAVVLAVIAAEGAVACVNLAAGHWLTGALALASAAVTGFLLYAVQRLVEVNLELIAQNGQLIFDARHAGDDTVTFERRDSGQ